MTNITFLIGNPCSGKTSLYRRLETRLNDRSQSAFRLNDRTFFFRALELDADHAYHHFNPDGTHAVTDPRLFEIQFRLLREALLETEWIEDWVFVELTSPDYFQALAHIGMDIVKDSRALLIEVPLAVALARNAHRRGAPGPHDDGPVPEHYIRRCYAQRGKISDLPVYFERALVLGNSRDDPAHLDALADQAAAFLLA